MEDHGLTLRRVERDDRASAHFAARASRRGNRDEWDEPRPIRFVVELRQIHVWSLDQQPGGFTHIEGATSAYRNEAVTLILPECLGRFPDVALDGIRMNTRIKEPC